MSGFAYLREMFREDWQFVSRWTVWAWIAFYTVFMAYAWMQRDGYLLVDSANLIVHEGGHLLFGWLGPTMGLWGGTILQWLVPLLLAGYFCFQRQLAATGFSLFFFFENWLYTATYMADARAMNLPLVSAGETDRVEHDWNAIFASLGVLQYDTTIALVVRVLGWGGMIGVVAWFFVLGRASTEKIVNRKAR